MGIRSDGDRAFRNGEKTKRTYFPRKSLPSMMTLTFLKPILERAGKCGRDRCKSFAFGKLEDHKALGKRTGRI